jgi:ribosome recycling factor
MKKTLSALKSELVKVRTGRANPTLLHNVEVEYYGVMTPLNQVANIGVPNPRSLIIQAWDKSVLGAIEKAILKANLGLTPLNDGKVIRINIPALTEERRKELVRVVHRMGEESKVALRNIRRDANEKIKKLKKNSQISEDNERKGIEKIQEIINNYEEEIDEILSRKEKEIMEF